MNGKTKSLPSFDAIGISNRRVQSANLVDRFVIEPVQIFETEVPKRVLLLDDNRCNQAASLFLCE